MNKSKLNCNFYLANDLHIQALHIDQGVDILVRNTQIVVSRIYVILFFFFWFLEIDPPRMDRCSK